MDPCTKSPANESSSPDVRIEPSGSHAVGFLALRVRVVSRVLTSVRLLTVVLAVATLFVAFSVLVAGASGDTEPPTVPANVQVTPGATSPVIAVVEWEESTDDFGVLGYRVWRSLTTTATPAYIGHTKQLTYTDVTGVPGQAYYYRVSAYDASGNESAKSAAAGPVASAWVLAPHANYSANSDLCRMCHVPHVAASEGLMRPTASGGDVGEEAVCLACHDGQGASTNVKNGSENSFALASGHSLDPDEDPDLTDACSSCHGPHADWEANRMLPAREINGVAGIEADNSWCFACHNATHDWYGAGYPSVASPVRDASGYPIEGTFPGPTVYADPGKNAHASIPATGTVRQAGDCLYCHASHRGGNEYDGLIGMFRPSTPETLVDDQDKGTYAESCFACHGGVVPSELATVPVDIKQFVTSGAERAGHRISTAGGTLPAGAPLPCYNCHNPHGSSRGNASLLSDELGQDLDTSTDEGVRAFCFTCHSSSDGYVWDSVAVAYVAVSTSEMVEGLRRDGTGGNVLKLPVTNGHAWEDPHSCYMCHGDNYAAGGSNVHNPTGGVSGGGESCDGCHSALTGMVDDTTTYHHVLDHEDPFMAPGPDGEYPVFESTEATGMACVSCHVDHSEYSALPGGIGKGYSLRDDATTSTPSPANTDEGLCLSCHVNKLERNTAGQKANVIPEPGVWKLERTWWEGPDPVNEPEKKSPHNYTVEGDFDDGSTFYANCAKCHGTLGGTLSTGKFAVHFSPEQRLINSLGDTVTYNVNEEQMCFRCHSRASDPLDGTRKPSDFVDWYGTKPMKLSNVMIYEQMMNGSNVYGHKPHEYHNIHLLSETQEELSQTKHVECADCHNHHVVGLARHEWGTTNLVSPAIRGVTGQGFVLGSTGYDGLGALKTVNMPSDSQINAQLFWKDADFTDITFNYATYEYEICFKCHSSANSNYKAWGGKKSGAVETDRWTNVAADFNVGNQSRHPVIATNGSARYDMNGDGIIDLDEEALPGYEDTAAYGTSKVADGQLASFWSPGDSMYCSDCHGHEESPLPTDSNYLDYTQGPHGSSVEYSLRGPNPYWPKDPNGTLWTLNMVDAAGPGDPLPFCSNCHPAIKANVVHQKSSIHKNAACVRCHLLIPHGGGMSRLIADADSDMPARYAYNNDKSSVMVSSFTKRAATSYTTGDCSISPAGVAASCTGGGGKHSLTGNKTGANGTGTWENW